MKAIKDEKIICRCGTEVGYFFNSVESNASITPEDIRFHVSEFLNNEEGYSCPKCKAAVAKLISLGQWKVYRRNEWIQ
jgi:hypothetical protein